MQCLFDYLSSNGYVTVMASSQTVKKADFAIIKSLHLGTP